MLNLSLIKVSKAERATGGKNLIKRDKADFIIRLRSAYRKDSVGQQNYKKLMSEATFKGIENRTSGENGVIYVLDRAKITEYLNTQLKTASGDSKEQIEKTLEFLGNFDGEKFWDITAKDMELDENLAMLLEYNKEGLL